MGRKPEGDRALTQAERNARTRRRALEREVRKDEALRRIEEEARTLREAREIAAAAREDRK